jgi:hypothetical protein
MPLSEFQPKIVGYCECGEAITFNEDTLTYSTCECRNCDPEE